MKSSKNTYELELIYENNPLPKVVSCNIDSDTNLYNELNLYWKFYLENVPIGYPRPKYSDFIRNLLGLGIAAYKSQLQINTSENGV
jgi:hypothetical protein